MHAHPVLNFSFSCIRKPNKLSVVTRQKAFCMASLFTVREHGKSVRNSPHDTNTVCHFESIQLRFQARPLKWLPCVRVEGRGRSRRVCFVWELLAASQGFLKARATWRHPNSSLTQKHKDALDELPVGSTSIRSRVSPARKWVTLYSPIHPQTGPSIPSCPRASTAPTLICRLNYLIKEWLNIKRRRHPALFIRSATERITDSVSMVFLIENFTKLICDVHPVLLSLISAVIQTATVMEMITVSFSKILMHQFSKVLHVHVYDS